MEAEKSCPNNARPKVSVISIALQAEEFTPLRQALSRQTFQDFEFVGEIGGAIPEAWNRAIERARGDILVFTETDAMPVTDRWLDELVKSIPDENTVVKGLEVTGFPWDLANLAGHRNHFTNAKFDQAYSWAEDTEFFCRLKEDGVRLLQLNTAPVIHPGKLSSKHMHRRAFRYGLYWARLRNRFQDPVELMGVAAAGKVLVGALLNLLGMMVGSLIYWPERRRRRVN